ncbi:MAG: hypothetical protein RL090_303 [Bacteroidota bacterium]
MKLNKYIFLAALSTALLLSTYSWGQTQLIVDGGFEGGSGSTAWVQSSTNFGTPLCDLATCGNGSGTGPRTGNFWAWFGGFPGGVETSSLTQTVVIPSGASVTMSFWLEQAVCDGPQDLLEVRIDGTTVFSTDGASNLCGLIGYSQQSINLSTFADGQPHDVEFFSTTFSSGGGTTNFFVDDVSILATSGGGGGCPNLVVDGGFESGPAGPAWSQNSTNFGTPLCDVANCGNGGGTGPRTGNYWAYFGGFSGGVETGTVSQSVVLPTNNTITLKFYLEQPECDGPQDFLEVRVDGQQVYQTTGSNPICGTTGYVLQTVNLSAFADGNPHLIEFNSTTFSANGGVTNFFVDDVVLESCPSGGGSGCTDTTTFALLNIAIPDDDPNGVTDSKTITGISGNTLGVDCKLAGVCFSIDHTWVGDLIVRLIAPNGTTVSLLDRPGVPATLNGCDGDNIVACVERGLGNEMENVCNPNTPSISGNFTAALGTNLDIINAGGGNPNGNWQLFVSDNVGFDTGSIIEWKLIFDNGPVANWNAPSTLCSNAAPINLNSLVTGTTGGTWSGPGVSGSTFNPSGLNGPVAITYTVTVGGCTDLKTKSINVFNGAPVATFTSSATGLTVYFDNNSTGGSSYSWNFGDGNSSTAENPVHTYAAAGFYNVSLTVTNSCGNNTFTFWVAVLACNENVTDGGFENGPGSGSWTEASTNFGTPLCDLAGCGNGGGTGPRTGTYWSWFGGIPTFEESSIEQSFGPVASNNDLTLYFWLEQPECDSPDDFLKVVVDSDTLFATTGSSNLCGQIGYSLQSVNLNAYADGQTHTLKFFSRIYGANSGVTSFFVDDISLLACIGSGISESGFGKDISLFPTPASESLSINFGKAPKRDVKVSFHDVVGKVLLENKFDALPSDHIQTFDVSGLSKGVYTVSISSGEHVTFRKVIIQ